MTTQLLSVHLRLESGEETVLPPTQLNSQAVSGRVDLMDPGMPCLDLQIRTQDAAVSYNWFCHLMSLMSADVRYQVNFARLCQLSEIKYYNLEFANNKLRYPDLLSRYF